MATTGLFPVQLRVATPNLGAPVLWLNLLVNTVEKTASGLPASRRPSIRRCISARAGAARSIK